VLERARPYGVKGLKSFVRDLNRNWRLVRDCSEGRVDADGEAIELISIHSAKGLEWPVVIPINTATALRSRETFVHRPDDDTLHWVIGDVVPPELLSALEVDDERQMRERERLWYVACTRARELLIVPELRQAEQRSWARIVDMVYGALPTLDLAHTAPAPSPIGGDPPNLQTAEFFAAEAAAIEAAAAPITWIRPSDHDPDRIPTVDVIPSEAGTGPEADAPVGPGRVRGLLLHKLMEEVLDGAILADVARFSDRARELLAELIIDSTEAGSLPDVGEIAATAWRTLQLPEIAALRERLHPEWPIYSFVAGEHSQTALAGRVDAIAFDGDRPDVVIDWKSDINPSEAEMRGYASQLEDYLRATGATRGALVYMTAGSVHWVFLAPAI